MFLAKKKFLYLLKNKIIFNYSDICGNKKMVEVEQQNFSPSCFGAVVGSGIWDPRSGIRDG